MGDYVCRLVMRLTADDPSQAPQEFVNYLVEGGLVSWIYRVEDPDTKEILGYYNGKGVAIDMDEIVSNMEAEDAEDENAEGEVQTPVESVELPELPDVAALATGLEVTVTSSATPSDEELLALAESLNETEQL